MVYKVVNKQLYECTEKTTISSSFCSLNPVVNEGELPSPIPDGDAVRRVRRRPVLEGNGSEGGCLVVFAGAGFALLVFGRKEDVLG